MRARQRRRKRAKVFLLSNLSIIALIAAFFFGYRWFFSDPSLKPESFSADLPQDRAAGALHEDIVNGDVTLRVTSYERFSADELPPDMELGARATPGRTTHYVALELTLQNRGDEPVSADYYGQVQCMDFLLGSRQPTPQTYLPALPRETERVAEATALPPQAIPPKEVLQGFLVFPIPASAKALSLFALPQAGCTEALPAFEVGLEPTP